MPKRQRERETSEERCLRMLQKYEKRLLSKRRKRESRRIIYSSEEDNAENQEHFTEQMEPDDLVNNGHIDQTQERKFVPVVDLTEPGERALPDSEDDMEIVPAVSSVVNQVAPDANDNPENPAVAEDIYDAELLNALGSFDTEEIFWGENIHEDISKRLQFILQNGLKKENKEELNKKYLFPNNAQFMKGPTLNPEVHCMLTDTYRNRDKLMLGKQNQLGKSLSALGSAMTLLLKKNSNIIEAMRILNDCAQMIADSHYCETYTRRSLIIPLVEKSIVDPLKETKRDQFLFGDKLADLVKSSKGIKKTGNMIQATSLNWRGPSNRGRQKYQQTANRFTGPRTSQYLNSNRRRLPPPPPPTANRRAAQPPPPPPYMQGRRHQPAQTAPAIRRPPPNRAPHSHM